MGIAWYWWGAIFVAVAVWWFNRTQVNKALKSTSYEQVIRLFPGTFKPNKVLPAPSEKQLKFLYSLGFEVSDNWTRPAVSFALGSYRELEDILDFEFSVHDEEFTKQLLHAAFSDDKIARNLFTCWNADDTDLARDRITIWIEKTYNI